MTLSDLFRISVEKQWIKIAQSEKTIFDGFFKDVPEHLLDCTIKNVMPAYNGYVDIFLIDLND